MPLADNKADVFICKLVCETEDGYEYESNEFRTSKLTEADISADPLKFLDYEEREKTQEEIQEERFNTLEIENEELKAKNEMLEECLIELANIIYA